MKRGISELDEKTVHSLSTNQVVVSLAVAVKELVENALDAKADKITVTLVDNGVELIEVKDNGSGISADNYDKIAMRHATSKLQEFDDLEAIGTFGFRGEALAALGAISTLKVFTKTADDEIGSALEFDQYGAITSHMIKAQSSNGTIIRVENLFHRIPVRRTVFKQNAKREAQRALATMMSYALIANARIVVTTKNGRSMKTEIQTRAGDSLKGKIASVLGGQISKEEVIEDHLQKARIFKFNGFISKTDSGGRTSPDRQFFFVNGRPIDAPFLSRIINQEWRKVTSKKYPVVVLNIEVDQSAVDINLAPDKRTVLLQNQKHCQFRFRILLQNIWGATERDVVSMTQLSMDQFSMTLNTQSSVENSTESSVNGLINDVTFSEVEEDSNERPSKLPRLDFCAAIPPLTGKDRNSAETSDTLSIPNNDSKDQAGVLELYTLQMNEDTTIGELKPGSEIEFIKPKTPEEDVKTESIESNSTIEQFINFEAVEGTPERDPSSEELEVSGDLFEGTATHNDNVDDLVRSLKKIGESLNNAVTDSGNTKRIESIDLIPTARLPESVKEGIEEIKKMKIIYDDNSEPRREREHKGPKIKISLESIKAAKEKEERSNTIFQGREFYAKFNDQKKAEDELTRKFSKKDFTKLQVIGQFNRGFIIVTVGQLKDDLFLIDQHACDEKFNFERLMSKKIDSQPLVIGKRMTLNPGEDQILQDKVALFKKYGFDFNFSDPECVRDVSYRMTAVPRVGKSTLGEEDVHEMLFLINEGDFNPKPSKIRRINAMAACRSSVMIGEALKTYQMERMLKNMSTMDQPWNCPHGRPTMRHLVNTARLHLKK
ncbi:unnamed protein product [Oikopleura dioica]|uniref:Uncharacterized protein n=1 Tax=Oikopleura dioica TaxID=34765 RepID=E4XIP6_OIKDI|nr:unnamed protein product [Oikopleura dioica]